MLKGQHICITGGAGFIGSTIVGVLIENNTITVLDNMKRNALSQCSYAKHPNLTIIEGDVCHLKDVHDAVKDANYIIHCAGIAGIDTVCKQPIKTLSVNILGSYNVLEAALALKNLKRIVCFSTSEVFGGMALSACESDKSVIGSAGEARWTYAVSKITEEHLAMAYFKEKNLPTTILRPFNIYGPGQIGEGAIKIFIEQALQNKPITIYGDGTQIRAWCYIDDMVEGTLRCLEYDCAIGESFNIGNSRSVQTIFGLANTVVRVLKSQSTITFVPALSADIELRIPCVEKAQNFLNFDAKIDLEEGILRTAHAYKQN